MSEMDTLFAIIYGAAVSAFTGALTAYLTERMHTQRLKKETIYKPLYNDIYPLSKNEWSDLPEGYHTKWSTMDYYSKLLIDRDLYDALEKFEGKIKEYLEIRGRGTEILEKKDSLQDLKNAVKRALPPQLIKDEEVILLEKQNGQIKLEELVYKFRTQLLLCKSGTELYESLVEYSKSRIWGYGQYFEKWWTENPKIFEDLVRECSNIKSYSEYKTIYEEQQKKRDEIIALANELKIKLEKRIKRVL